MGSPFKEVVFMHRAVSGIPIARSPNTALVVLYEPIHYLHVSDFTSRYTKIFLDSSWQSPTYAVLQCYASVNSISWRHHI